MNLSILEELEKESEEILSKAKDSEKLDAGEISEEAEDEEQDEADGGDEEPEEDEDDAEDEDSEEDEGEEDEDSDADDIKKAIEREVLSESGETEIVSALAEIIAKSLADVMDNVTDAQAFSESSAGVLAKSLLAQNVTLDRQTRDFRKMNKSLAEKLDTVEAKVDDLAGQLESLGTQPAHMRKSVASYTERNFAQSVGGTGEGQTQLTKSQINDILTSELMSGSSVVTDQDILNNESGASMRPEIRALIDSRRAR